MYDEVLSTDPTVYQINLNRAAVLRELGRPDEARAAYQAVLEQDAQNAAALVSLGEMEMADDDMNGALEYWEAAVDSTADEVIPYNVAQISFQNGETDKAIEYYMIAADRRADWAEPFVQMGIVYLNKGDFPAAAERFEMAIEVEPDSAAAAQAQAMLDALPKPE